MKILLVEKDKALREIIVMLLRSYKHEVIVATQATEALTILRTEFPDIILIDKNLKDKDGIQVTKIIKDDFLTAYIPIIVLIDHRQIRKELLAIEQGVDDYIVKPPDPIDLQIRIEMAVRRSTHQFFANALTRLPGNRAIDIVLRRIIHSGKRFSFAYIDIDGFKYFNDRYGYLKGDAVIIQTAQIITQAVKNLGNALDFVGHVGGDDFVVVTTPDKEKEIALEIVKEFDRLIPCHYTADDRSRGLVLLKNRQGKMAEVALMSLSIALVNNTKTEIRSTVELSTVASEIKSHLKTMSGSKFLKNRRVKDQGLRSRQRQIKRMREEIEQKERSSVKQPLGQLLLQANLINETLLEEALLNHWRTGQSLGETIIGMGLVSRENILKMLEMQGVV